MSMLQGSDSPADSREDHVLRIMTVGITSLATALFITLLVLPTARVVLEWGARTSPGWVELRLQLHLACMLVQLPLLIPLFMLLIRPQRTEEDQLYEHLRQAKKQDPDAYWRTYIKTIALIMVPTSIITTWGSIAWRPASQIPQDWGELASFWLEWLIAMAIGLPLTLATLWLISAGFKYWQRRRHRA